MKRTIRRGCFETNSSSMHSIVVTKLDGDSSLGKEFSWFQNKDDNKFPIYHSDVEFGWGFEVLSTIDAKAKYAFAEFWDDQDMVDRISGIFLEKTGCYPEWPTETEDIYRIAETEEEVSKYDVKWIDDPEDDKCEICVLKSELEEGKTSDFTELEWKQDTHLFGYIDHESVGLLRGFLKKTGVSIEDFITKARYIVITDNDNECRFGGMLHSGILDMDKIESWYPGMGISYETYTWRQEQEEDTEDIE